MSTAIDSKLVVVHTAFAIIERDAILAALASAGIDAESHIRDVDRRVTDTTIDLSLEGYSALNDQGYRIEVAARDSARAQAVVQTFLDKSQEQEVVYETQAEKSVRRFVASCLFTIVLPVILHGFALYHFRQALAQKANLRSTKVVLAWLVFFVTLITTGLLVSGTNWHRLVIF